MPKPYFVTSASKNIAQMIRVNHAGEFAAQNIYKSQLRNIKSKELYDIVEEMCNQELEHLEYYKQLMLSRNIRPSLFLPLWGFLSKALGCCTSSSPDKIMLCTKSVEEVIEQHYKEQANTLKLDAYKSENNLSQNIQKHLADELHHKNVAEKYTKLSFSNFFISYFIKLACNAAIKISKHL